MPDEILADAKVRYTKFPTSSRQVSLRNTGVNTLWISFDRKKWFDVACGTSWDDRVNVMGFWYCTQTGRTTFALNAVQLQLTAGDKMPAPAADEETPAEEGT